MQRNHLTEVVLADSQACRIYQYKRPTQLTLLKEMMHPENKLKGRDLVTDRPGHYMSGSNSGVYSPASDPKAVKIDDFAREIAKELDQHRKSQHLEKIVMVASAPMKGLILLHCNKQLRARVSHAIEKNAMDFTQKKLLTLLNEQTRYPKGRE